MFEISNLCSKYGEVQVLFCVDLTISKGECHALLGRNGVGKSTTLKTIMNLVPASAGQLVLHDLDITQMTPQQKARLGIAYVPETRDIFSSLSVLENLQIADIGRVGMWDINAIFDLFPRLKERLHNGGGQLSGGEQQMLAIARALLMNPELLILDEPTEGLAPLIIKQIKDVLLKLKQSGMTILIVEQNFNFAMSLADQVTILSRGQVVWSGAKDAIENSTDVKDRWLGF